MLRTASQRRVLCRECPVAKTADLIGDTCSLLIVRDLLPGPRRFGELSRALKISTRTLTLKLKSLEKAGFAVHTGGGPYRLTPKGRALKPIIDSLKRYGEKYL